MQQSVFGLETTKFSPGTLLFDSNDPLQVARDVARVFKPHQLRVRGSDAKLHARMNNLSRGNFSVSRLEYGAEVEIDPGPLDDFFLVQIPIAGLADIACGDARFESSTRAASLLSPTLPVRMRWHAGNAQICVRFENDFVRRHCASHLGHELDRAVEFDPKLSLETVSSRYFLRLLGTFVDEVGAAIDAGDAAGELHPLMLDRVGDQFAASLLNALLYGQRHSWTDALARPAPAAAPFFVRRAEEFVREHFREFLTVETLANVVGVSTRTLFAGFREYRGTTPMAYLRDTRLDRARASLLAGEANDTAQVTNIALDCGFAHLGRFAASYRSRFGESPSTTARFREARRASE
jgi:AraC-like DNA-binding protein